MLNVVSFNSVVTKVLGPKLGAIKKKKKKNIQRLKQRGRNDYTIILVCTHSVILVIQAM